MSSFQSLPELFPTLTPPAQSQMESLLRRFSSSLSAKDVQCTWESLQLQPGSPFAGHEYPQSQPAWDALQKALKTEADRTEAKKRVATQGHGQQILNTRTVHQVVPQQLEWVTPPHKKRGSADSPDLPDPKRQQHAPPTSTTSSTGPKILATYNSDVPPPPPFASITPHKVTPMPETLDYINSPTNKRYMFSTLDEVSEKLRNGVIEFGERNLTVVSPPRIYMTPEESTTTTTEIKTTTTTSSSPEITFDNVGAPIQGRNVLVLGRIVCDAESTKMSNLKVVFVEGVNGVIVNLDFSQYPSSHKLSLFPGQHVIVEGAFAFGTDKIVVERIYCSLPVVPAIPRTFECISGFNIWITSGPYTTQSPINFEPLGHLLRQCSVEKPGLLILLGPFLDSRHPELEHGKPTVRVVQEGGEVSDVTNVRFPDIFTYFFEYMQAQIDVLGLKTRIVMVPSTYDVCHDVQVFPQPPLDLDRLGDAVGLVKSGQVMLMPNPCTFKVQENGDDGVVFAVSTIDVLKHFVDVGSPSLGYEPMENFARLQGHLLSQRSFYPIIPPPMEACVNLMARDRFQLFPTSQAPDVVVTPSMLHQNTAVNCNDTTLCINPGASICAKTRMTVAKMYCPPGGTAQGHAAQRFRVEFESFVEMS